MQPKTQLVLVALCAVILGAGITGIVLRTQSARDTPNLSAALTGARNDTTKSSAPAASSSASPSSNIGAAEQKVVATLDQLGIRHTKPTRTTAGLGSKASFDITVNGFDAGINVFPDASALKSWEQASDALGGVNVSFDNAALSLNSSRGIADSVRIAPKIAAAIGGTAHGV